MGGGAVLVAIVIGALQFNPSVVAGAVAAAVLGGIVAAGSSHSTAKEATHELTAAEAKRTALIGHIDLRLVSDRDGPQ
jgi:predicted acylesterase/phospholipase RssA